MCVLSKCVFHAQKYGRKGENWSWELIFPATARMSLTEAEKIQTQEGWVFSRHHAHTVHEVQEKSQVLEVIYLVPQWNVLNQLSVDAQMRPPQDEAKPALWEEQKKKNGHQSAPLSHRKECTPRRGIPKVDVNHQAWADSSRLYRAGKNMTSCVVVTCCMNWRRVKAHFISEPIQKVKQTLIISLLIITASLFLSTITITTTTSIIYAMPLYNMPQR